MVHLDDDPIALVDSRYEAWVVLYEAERDRVRDALADAGLADDVVRVEHVGSTAVPELPAKDVVDLDVVVDDGAVGRVATTLESVLGGTRYDNHDGWNVLARRHDGQRFNVHVFARSDDGWKRSVATRVVLREREDRREAYESLKRRLAVEHDDLGDYSTGKTEFMALVLEDAREGEFGLAFSVPGPGDG